MKLIVLQIGTLFAVTAYLACWVMGQRRRRAQSWQQLIACLQLEHGAGAAGALSFEVSGCGPWCRRRAAMRSVWNLFANAGVLLQMVDFAIQNGASMDRATLADLRMDALQIRFYALGALARLLVGIARDATVMHALRAQAAYAEMTLRMTELLEARADEALPAFVAAV